MLLFRSPYLRAQSELYHGTGDSRVVNRIMTTLTYRGKTYIQTQNNPDTKFVELTYRRNVYTNRKKDVLQNERLASLSYRGIKYQR